MQHVSLGFVGGFLRFFIVLTFAKVGLENLVVFVGLTDVWQVSYRGGRGGFDGWFVAQFAVMVYGQGRLCRNKSSKFYWKSGFLSLGWG